MDRNYEYVYFENDFSIKAFVHRIRNFKLHWHNQLEILYVVKGSINMVLNGNTFILHKNEMALINSGDIHSTGHTEEGNLIIALHLIDSEENHLYNLRNLTFDNESFMKDQRLGKAPIHTLRSYLAQIVWEYNKRTTGFEHVILSMTNSLLACLLRNYYLVPKNGKENNTDNTERLSSILNYINDHFSEKISLKTLSEKEHMNYYYMSHFFKSTTGLTFQEYLNNYRLDKSLEFIGDMQNSITEIAYSCGFANAKAYSTAFKNKFGILPSEYRKTSTQKSVSALKEEFLLGKENELYYSSFNNKEDLHFVFDLINDSKEILSPKIGSIEVTVNTDLRNPTKRLHKYWNTLTAFGRAAECLREDIRMQLRNAKKNVDFKYMRFHGIFNDEMMVFNQRDTGKVVYNWAYVDSVIDFLLSIDVRPFFELGFMPTGIASSDETVFWWKGNITPPKDMAMWTDLVKAFITHCINRYGNAEVSRWYIEVWNEPDYQGVFWAGTQQEYFDFYKHTAEAIRGIDPRIKIGGPAITHIQYEENTWLRKFTHFCASNNVPVDFISFHIYSDEATIYSPKGNDIFPIIPKRTFGEDDMVDRIIAHNTKIVQDGLGTDIEIHATEWNISPKPRFLVRDTAFMAPFIIKNILSNTNTIDSLGFWTVSDAIEELKAPISPFHGGLGMINFQGIPKPSMHAYYLLNKLGHDIISQGEGYIITKDDSSYQILCYNDTYFDSLAMRGDFSRESDGNRYQIFLEKPTIEFHINITGLEEGTYQQALFALDREHGSSFDTWVEMGMPTNMTQEEIDYLKGVSVPSIVTRKYKLDDAYRAIITVPIFGCVLVVFKREI